MLLLLIHPHPHYCYPSYNNHKKQYASLSTDIANSSTMPWLSTICIQAILPYHWLRQLLICQINGTLLHRQTILPNHWHLACSSTYRQFCQITGTLSTDKQFCQITGTLSTYRQFCQITGLGNCYSVKSLAHSSTYRQFCQITGTWHAPSHTGNSAKSLARSSTYRQFFCQISGTLSTDRQFCKITGTGNSAKSLAPCSTYRQFCQFTGTLLYIQAILPNHWHTTPHTGNANKSLAYYP